MNENILVSVIMPTYKRSDMLERAIDSVRNQTYSNVEIIVVDDNNPETEWRKKTSETMDNYSNDSRVRYICHEKNMNGSVARNTGIENARGEVITFLDDDDWYYPEKIEKQLNYLVSHPQYRACYCGWRRDEEDIIPKLDEDMTYGYLSGTNIIITNSIMMWRENALKCGGFDPAFKRHQEAVFMLRYFRTGEKVGCLPEVLVGFDTSDRSNEPNLTQDEQYNFQYLNEFQDLIDKCEEKNPGARTNIYIYRMKIVLIKYLKYKDYKNAFSLYCKLFRIAPIKLNAVMIKYVVWRIFVRNKKS